MRIALKTIVLLTVMLSAKVIYAQNEDKNSKFVSEQDLFIVTLNSDNLTNLPSVVEAKPLRSRGLSFLFMKDNMNTSGNIGFGGGIGFTSQNFHTNSFLYQDSTGKTAFQPFADSVSYKTNKLSLNFIDAAIEFRLHFGNASDPAKRIKLSAGVKGSYLLQSHVKFRNDEGTSKSNNVKGVRDFQYGITARLGYSSYALSFYYGLAESFDKGPAVTPFSIGISFTP